MYPACVWEGARLTPSGNTDETLSTSWTVNAKVETLFQVLNMDKAVTFIAIMPRMASLFCTGHYHASACPLSPFFRNIETLAYLLLLAAESENSLKFVQEINSKDLAQLKKS